MGLRRSWRVIWSLIGNHFDCTLFALIGMLEQAVNQKKLLLLQLSTQKANLLVLFPSCQMQTLKGAMMFALSNALFPTQTKHNTALNGTSRPNYLSLIGQLLQCPFCLQCNIKWHLASFGTRICLLIRVELQKQFWSSRFSLDKHWQIPVLFQIFCIQNTKKKNFECKP